MTNQYTHTPSSLTIASLNRIAMVLGQEGGANFFPQVVKELWSILDVDMAFVGVIGKGEPITISTVAYCVDGKITDNINYQLADTPCQNVANQPSSSCTYASNIQELFPDDLMLADLDLESYAGAPLRNSDGQLIGLLVALSGRPLSDENTAGAVLEIFASRVAAELDRLQTREALQASEQVYHTMLYRLPVGILECDTAGIITFASEPYERMMGYSPGAAVGQKIWTTAADPEHAAEIGRYLEHLVREQPEPTPYFADNKTLDGRQIHIRVDWDYIRDETDQMVGFTTIVSDNTAQVRAELARTELEADLRQRQKMEAVGTLAKGIAHDFNNILMGIQGFTDLAIYQSPDNPSCRASLTEVTKAIKRATDIVNRILTFSRSSSDRPEAVALPTLAADALHFLRASIPSTIKIVSEIDESAGMVWANPGQLHQAIVNLCTNSYQAMPDGGTLTLRVTGNEDGAETIEVVVADTGCGMDETTREHIFEPYFTTRADNNSSGLGMAIVHGIISSINGSIQVESAVDQGTRITITMPRYSEPDQPEYPPQKIGKTFNARIVFIDDDETICHFAQALFRRFGCTIETFTDATESLERIRQSPDSVDLIISDVTMPELTGIDVARAIREIRPDLPVVLCTGYSDLVEEGLDEDVGIREVLAKPVNTATFADLLSRYCPSED